MGFREALVQRAGEFGINLTGDQLAAFNCYYELLVSWNEKVNLTAITEPQEVAVKHMIDSLSCYDDTVFFDGCAVIDVGTGAGFPGLPLKIFRPDIKLTLLDSLNKRLLFLQAVIDKLGLNEVTILHSRAEEAGRKKELRGKYAVAVSRAVARLNVLCELCLPLVTVGGYFVSLKGAQYSQEVSEAGNAVKVLGGEIVNIRPVKLPGLDDIRTIVYIKKIANIVDAYPRRPGIPEKKPII